LQCSCERAEIENSAKLNRFVSYKEAGLSQQSFSRDFEQAALPYLNNAYNLARWLTRNEQDAEDIVQEAFLRAFRFYKGFRGGDVRPWLLKIVRNTYYTWSRQNRVEQPIDFDSELVSRVGYFGNPEEIAIHNVDRRLLRIALEALPPRLREMLILRELEGMSYKEISIVVGVPAGTVMSGLSRARIRLRQSVADLIESSSNEMRKN
jgi:RNA polymerase sigma factor (sigma-70 family)